MVVPYVKNLCLLKIAVLLLGFFLILLFYNQRSINNTILLDIDDNWDSLKTEYNRFMPLIFIGGVPRSGTTLMRAILDAHPDVRCGPETRVIPRVLQLYANWMNSEKELLRFKEAGLTKKVLHSAFSAFILEIIVNHGEKAPRLCNKDPLTLKTGSLLLEMFPNSKFLFMIRDGRAAVHSMITRKVTITGFDLTNYEQCLTRWNSAIERMNKECTNMGPDRCFRVPYEQLVLQPNKWLPKILEFLDLPWHDAVLQHQNFINNEISLSRVEKSSDQVIQPIHIMALKKWVGHIPKDVEAKMADIAPMLSKLGYDPYDTNPSYGNAEDLVLNNTQQIVQHSEKWNEIAQSVHL